MSDYKSKLENTGFCNWARAHLAIYETKSGLQDVVCNTLQARHQTILNYVKTQVNNNFRCTSCYTKTIICCSPNTCNKVGKKCSIHQQFRKCQNGVCDLIRNKTIATHKHRKPSWKNTHAELWGTSYWEYAKCFMPDGYSNKSSFSDTDFNGIITILLTHEDFVHEVDEAICKKARSMVNDVRHNSELSLSDQEFQDVVCSLQQLMSCCEIFENDPKIAGARNELEQLKDCSKDLSEENAKKCLQNQYETFLKQDLIEFNKELHGTTPISPIFDEIDMALQDVYVQPTINRVLTGCSKVNKGRRTARVGSFKEIFQGPNGPYREIYLCADSGLGKTVFGKRLTLMWCHANASDSDKVQGNFTQDDIDEISKFDFVFFVSLKESDQVQFDVDEMIQQQIITNLARASFYSPKFVEQVLTERKCLVILEGLDEWSHEKSNIPLRRPRQKCTFFTTTRPWKFTVARIKQSKIDVQLEMTGIDKDGKQNLIRNILKHFGDCGDHSGLESILNEFETRVARRNVTELETNPMLLLYLIGLWQDGKPLGKSRCDLYCNILEMLLQKGTQHGKVKMNQDEVENIPVCFTKKNHCCKNISSLKELANLAFITLFNQNLENRLVFNEDIANENMSENCIYFWLKTGIITRIVPKRGLTFIDVRISFIHKTFHEFFAALHLSFCPQEGVTTDLVIRSCSDINSFLLNASFLENLCGLSHTASITILNGIADIFSSSIQTKRLRVNTYAFSDYWEMCDLMQEFQNVMVACVNECRDNGYDPCYKLDDVFLNFDGELDSQHASSLVYLTNHSNVKSIKFGRALSGKGVHELSLMLKVQDMRYLQKLDVWGQPDSKDVEMLLGASTKTLKCLLLHGCNMKGTAECVKHIEVSDKSVDKLLSLDVLESIDLYCISLKHEDIEKLIKWIEGRKTMRQIKIARVKCLDHVNRKCVFPLLDLSEHVYLDVIGVGNMCADQVKVNPSSIRELWAECNEPLVIYFLNDYSTSAINIHTLVIEFIDSSDTVKQILKALPQFTNLINLQLKGLDLQENDLILSSHKSVKHVRLIEIDMGNQALKNLIEELSTYSHSVTIEIASCNVQHDNGTESFEDLRQRIESSTDEYAVIANLKCSGHDNAFAFRTIPLK